jgi:hypothetical protein
MTEVKLVFTAHLKANDIEGAMELARANYGSEVADYGVFTVEREKAICGDHLVQDCGCKI